MVDPQLARAAAAAPLGWLLGERPPAERMLLRVAGIHTVGVLVDRLVLLCGTSGMLLALGLPPSLAGGVPAVHAAFQRVVDSRPPGWRRAAEEGVRLRGGAPSASLWWPAFLEAARWPCGPQGGLHALASITVRACTEMQLGDVSALRNGYFVEYAQLASSDAPPAVGRAPDAAGIRGLFRAVWALPVDNRAEEVFWFLVYRAIHSHVPCCCGMPRAGGGRDHFFWGCPVAQAVVEEVQRCLPPAAGFVHRPHFWLLRAPPGQFEQAWMVVALAALSAMEHSRRAGFARQRATNSPPLTVEGAARRAVAFFWARLVEFCALGLAPASWHDKPCAFFQWVPCPAGDGTGSWRISRPAAS